MMTLYSKRQQLEVLRGQLELERSSFLSHWRSIADVTMPHRARFTLSEGNRGDRRNTKIIDSTPTMALRTLRSGMVAGITSPARPWFRLSTSDPDLAEMPKVKDWLHDVGTRMSSAFIKSNYYNVKPIVYGDLGNFGTAPYSMEEDFDSVIHCQSFAVGSYMIAKDYKGRVNTFLRDLRMTVAQIVEMFAKYNQKTGKPDWSNISDYVKNSYERGEYQSWVEVCHVIQPNKDYNPNRMEAKFKKFSSTYYERGMNASPSTNYMNSENDMKYLRESGYDYFPVLCPRWEVTGEDVYGTNCPGMTAVGDCNQLQWGEKKIAKAQDKMIDPPMVGPTSLRNVKSSILPADITFLDVREGQQGFRPAHEVQFRVDFAEQKQEQIRARIRRAYYEDLFLMLANDDRSNITAREIVERKEEKMIAIGPVLEQLNQDDLDPSVDILFDIMNRQGLIPPAPEDLQGVPLKVEYISVMAQAQKLVAVGGIERFAGFVGNIAGFDQSVLKKVDSHQMVDDYAEATGISPKIVRSKDEVDEIQAAEAQAMQQQQQQMAFAQTAQTAKTLSETDTEGENALTGLLSGLGGAQ